MVGRGGRGRGGVVDGRGYVGSAVGNVGNFAGARIGGAVDGSGGGDGGVVERILVVGEGFPGRGELGELGGGRGGARGGIRGREGGRGGGQVGG